MSGHSKWHNIKRKKEATDSQKSKVFTKMVRLISVAARQGGGDPNSNPSLRLAIEKAKQARMPKDNIEKAIKKGLGKTDGVNYEETSYEGFGPFGVALYIMVLTDNKNRTVSDIKNVLGRYSGSLGGPGSTSYIFQSDGDDMIPTFTVPLDDSQLEKVSDLIEALEDLDDVQQVYDNSGDSA
jgi:YebC/PmpR family DNA-binding regulatory protein